MSQPGFLQDDFVAHAADGDAILASQQPHCSAWQGAGAVGYDDSGVRQQVGGSEGLRQFGQGVVGGDAENKVDAAHLGQCVAAGEGAFARGDDEVGAAVFEGVPAAIEGFDAEIEAGAALHALEGFDIGQEGAGGHDGVVHDTDFGFITFGYALQPVFQVARRLQQPLALGQQGFPAGVRVTLGPLRRNRVTPSCSSSRATL